MNFELVLAPWRSPLARALHRNRSQPYSRYFQLATVQTDGRPANRTVVFRGFLGDTNLLKIITDSRSQKFDQILHQPWAEVCWYFTVTREQFRIAGELSVIDVNHPNSQLQQARQMTWQDLSDNARVQFAWPHPGKPRDNQETFLSSLSDPNTPLANFCLLLLDPVQVDHLELRGDPQNRWSYLKDNSHTWSTTAINP
ncbi:Npun_F5749 family FMN-dependent PPOX-type flavoprotein [Brasilonema sp. UFV-L1]|uniref:Npun_F5749 family FMN-dependent PPOX-type flavoprotein n=1 Tax=Brasilonema sp. UFV-L1 TaxID=2234130 RepID=UPI00145DB8A3|nr:Npun_F5749 family FMN-dependent PPOX-type flavoprotein [Brasilonema sp. UFV-L1]NMG10782.1 pyridoxamine 5'-phosphate oxidase [Brasilonema sp. UFV-L1]